MFRAPWTQRPHRWLALASLLQRAAVSVVLVMVVPSRAAPQPPLAELLQPQGQVEVRRSGATEWFAPRTNTWLSPGDIVRVGAASRALLRLGNDSVVRLDERAQVQIQPPPAGVRSPVLNLLRGALYFFHRQRPAETRFETPLVAGAIRGTEFHLTVEDNGRTVLALLEGQVELSNPQGQLALRTGEQAVVEPGGAPARTAVIEAVNVLQWCLYYPAVVDPDELELNDNTRLALAESFAAYRRGDVLRALASYPEARQPGTRAEVVYRAALRLAAGQVGESQHQLDTFTNAGPMDARSASLADALRTLIAAVKQQDHPPLQDGSLATSRLAESYFRQSRADLGGALESARAAVARSPDFGFGWARVAELEFGFGRTREALRAVDRALQFTPDNAHAWTVHGFLLAAQNRPAEARRAFATAGVLDAALGNAWLGRGLCDIRLGRLASGRDDLLVAAAVEPNRALLRSYLGKGFAESGDAAHAAAELELAQRLDPKDPTAWLYSALLNHQQNRVNESIRDLEHSQALNDNRHVYRSRLMLDSDRAVRSANLALLYRDAGLLDLATREAAQAVHHDYANYSAHLFLADSYNSLRDPQQVNLRYETVAFSELLMANLLAPAGAGAFSQYVSQQEYTRLFEQRGLGLSSSTEYSSRGDWVQRASQYGRLGRLSYVLEAGYRSLNGQRPNNDLSALNLAGTLKLELTPQDTLLLQGDHADFQSGDLRQYYDPRQANPTLRIQEEQAPNLFLGYHREWSPAAHTLLLLGRLKDHFQLRDAQAQMPTVLQDAGDPFEVTAGAFNGFTNAQHAEFEAWTVEAQHIQKVSSHTVAGGLRFQSGETKTAIASRKAAPALFVYAPLDQTLKTDLERWSVYLYDTWQIAEAFALIGGVSYDELRFPDNIDLPPASTRQRTASQLLPKAGLIWQPARGTTARAMYARSLGGLYYDQSVRLEPTQIAGFNQAFRSLIPESVAGLTPGAEFESWGLGVDQRFDTGTYLGVEGQWLKSRAERSVGAYAVDFARNPAQSFPSPLAETLEYAEPSLLVNANQLLGRCWALGARYRLSHAELKRRIPDLATPLVLSTYPIADSETAATLQQLQCDALFNHRSGFFAQFEALWTRQSEVSFRVPPLGLRHDAPGDDFWQFNVFGGYRLPNRRAELMLGVANLTDRDYRLHPVSLYAELPRQRTFVASLRFNF